MKPIEIASVIFSVLSLISGAAMWLLFRKYPSVDFSNASGTEKWLKVYLNRGSAPLYDSVIYCEGIRDDVQVEVAMQHNDSFSDNCYSYVNNIITPEGGTHLTGFKNAITKTFNSYARDNKLLKDSDPALTICYLLHKS